MMTQPMQHQPPPQHHATPASSSSEHQQQPPMARRTKHALKIVDPNTGKNVMPTSADQSAASLAAGGGSTSAVIGTESHRVSGSVCPGCVQHGMYSLASVQSADRALPTSRHGSHKPGKPGIVREFCKPGKVREFEIRSGNFL